MLIRNVLAALPGEEDFKRVQLRVRGSRIEKINGDENDGNIRQGGTPDEVIDASGLMLFPGAIDPHVHFDEPGFTHREDFFHGSCEAARGGVTTVIDMPCTSLPPVTGLENFRHKLNIVSRSAVVDYGFFGGIQGMADEEEIGRTVNALAPEVLGFKCYFISGMDTFPAVSEGQFKAAIQACAKAGRPLLLHAEDPDIIGRAEADLSRHEAAHSWRDYCASRPMEAEIAACIKALSLAADKARTLHIVHAGTAKVAAMAKAAGASCETCAHYLAFDEGDFSRLGASLKTAPPVKEAAQKSLLWRLLADGAIDFLASDHAGSPDYEKFTPDPLQAYGGIPGTGILFPYLLSEGLFAKRMKLGDFIRAVSEGAARRYGIAGAKGSLKPGMDADFVLVDPDATSLVKAEDMMSKSHISPFTGMRLAGRIVGTFVRGSCVYATPCLSAKGLVSAGRTRPGHAQGWIHATPGSGKFLRWGYTP